METMQNQKLKALRSLRMVKQKQAMISVKPELKELLDKLKIHKRETYGDVIERLIGKHETH